MRIKLNMGCGNKLYVKNSDNEVWVNVDIVPPEENPEVKGEVSYTTLNELNGETLEETSKEGVLFHPSDLRNLKWVDDGVADEIHAYHVIEHFYRTEVPAVLAEWHRVLKSGGVLCLEQPDVLKCAANLLLGVVRDEPALINQMGILGFFGAGTPEEPYMSHKWGWFPGLLKAELEKAGFTDVRVVPAQTHMGDARDFRIEGVKP